MISNRDQNENEMEALAPYPAPAPEEDQVVHRVEVFANGIKKIKKGMRYFFYPVTFIPSQINKKITKRNWQARAQAVPPDELIQPQQKAVYVANNTRAMDHNFFYILNNNRIWFKPIAAPDNSKWRIFGPDGLPPNGSKINKISSDGVNLIATDESEIVNYVHTNDINFFVTDDDWQIKNIKLDWTDRWVAIPIINKIVSLIKGKYLQLPPDCIAFAISQKGPEAAYYTDMSGQKQPEFLVGVTTLYALTKDGRIFFADPWLANGFWNEITAPEDGQFVAENIAAAASTIFLMRRDKTGKPIMYTRFADFDSTSSNPLLPACYDLENQYNLVRHLPGEDWFKQPDIPLERAARVTGEIAVLQTGRGQFNRQLRVEGTNAEGEPGYYYKAIYEKKWHFEVTPDQPLVFKSPPQLNHAPPPAIDRGGQIFTKKKNTPFKAVELKKFLSHGLNERGLHTTLELTLNNGRKLSLRLYARRGLAHLFGQRNNSPYWKLVVPEQYRLDQDPTVKTALKMLFKNKMSTSVAVNELENGDIEVETKHKKFKFQFKTDTQKENLSSSQPASCTYKHLPFTQKNQLISDLDNEPKNDVVRTTTTDRAARAHEFYSRASCKQSMFSKTRKIEPSDKHIPLPAQEKTACLFNTP